MQLLVLFSSHYRNMKRILLLPILAISLLPVFAHAQYTDVLDDTATEVYGSTTADSGDLTYVVGSIISVALSVLGIVLLIFMLYGGFLWMTAGGDAEQVKKAKTIMINATIGLIIVLASYAIANYVIAQLVAANLAS